MSFKEAPQVKRIADELITKYHPHLQDSKDLIGYYFRDGGVDWAGKAKKCTAFERHTTNKMLFVFINEEAWDYFKYDQRIALIDHELCHFARKGTRKLVDAERNIWEDVWENADDPASWYIREHDVEEFSDVIRRHGLWEKGIEQFATAVRTADHQMTLDDAYQELNKKDNTGVA